MANISGINAPVLNDQDYVDKIIDSFDAVDAHDHSSTKGLQIPTGGIADSAITNAKVSASAAIATSKLAALTASRAVQTDGSGLLSVSTVTSTELGYLSGVTSSIQTQLNTGSSGLSAHEAATAVHGATGAVVGTTNTQTLTNKSISGSTNTITDVSLSTGVTGTLPLLNGGTGTAAASANAAFNALSPLTTKGDVLGFSTVNARLPVGTNGTVLTADSAETTGLKWSSVLTNPMTTAGDIIVGGASGTPTRLAIGSASKVLRSDGTSPSYQYPEPTIASKTSNYNVTADDNLLLGDSSGGTFTFTLLAAATMGSGKRQIFQKTDTSFTAITITDGSFTTTLNTQNESVEIKCTGSAYVLLRRYIPSDWTSFTPTGSWANTTYTGFWKRNGSVMQVQALGSLTGTPTSTTFSITLPGSLTVATAKLVSTSGDSTVPGSGFAVDNGANKFPVLPRYSSTTAVAFVVLVDDSGTSSLYTACGQDVTQLAPFTWGNTDFIQVYFEVPITGWNG